MPDYIEKVVVDNDGDLEKMHSINVPEIYVLSSEIIPKDMRRGSRAFIIDKVAVAFCDGNDNWYKAADKPVAAGQPWSALFG